MAFDDATRGRLQTFVTKARTILTDEFTQQFQQDFGLDPNSGTLSPLESLAHLDDNRRATARVLREIFDHYLPSALNDGQEARKNTLDRMVREQAFTTLNRLAALRMMEARGLIMDCVGNAYQSKAFQLYQRVAGQALGETGDAYRLFLLSICDIYGADLPVLFDRFFPNGRLFPREPALLALLDLINTQEIAPLWSEDETIGWIYQYFNSRDERKAMRDASQAPRNSRELAVRNQFFTPRYVVEFLIDNTLGRLWYNWTGGASGLRDRCQYLLVKPNENPQPLRRLRDPRTIKLLDPACGSMHFGLYAFDLLIDIYHEAWSWENELGPGSLDCDTSSGTGLKSLHQTYADENAFLRDVPRLIIEHNIFGVDIDQRAAQIASLALWLRAQRAWHEAGVKAQDRPAIGRGHVVAAVAPPSEDELRQIFVKTLDPLDADLFEKTLLLLKGLPELGILLRVEKDIPRLVHQVFGDHGGMFRQQDEAQWRKAEARLHDALVEFAHAARASYQGRLFVEDALEVLRLVTLVDQKFDVIAMNPPFGQPTDRARDDLKAYGSDGWKDIYAGFFERSIHLKRNSGFIGAITSSQFFHTRQMKDLRENMIVNELPIAIVDLGEGVLDDAAVQTALTILGDARSGSEMAYADLFEADNKAHHLIHVIKTNGMKYLPLRDIAAIPGRPLCLHASPNILRQWRVDSALDPETANVVTGNHTFDDERFLRIFPEVTQHTTDWVQFEKGGEYQPFFCPSNIFLRWGQSGEQLRTLNIAAYGSDAQVMQSSKYWHKIGLCFNHVSSVGFSPRILPESTIFSSESISIFLKQEQGVSDDETKTKYLALLAFLSSTIAQELVYVFGRFRKIENRAVSGIPISFSRIGDHANALKAIAMEGVSLSRKLSSFDETSPCFVMPELVAHDCLGSDDRRSLRQQAVALYESLDQLCNSIAEVGSDDILAESRSKLVGQFSLLRANHSDTERVNECLSWAVGVAFGRFDWRISAGEQALKPNPDPFDALPTKSPGMLHDGAEPFHAHPGILVDDPGHPHDLSHLIEEVLAQIGAPIPPDVRRWLQREFFPIHLKNYSKSRRKAPIYWPLATASGAYTLWVYYPTITSQTLYTAVNDFLEGPTGKLKQVGQEAATLRLKAPRSRDEDRRLEALQDLEVELIDLRDALMRIAPTYLPNHDDGVPITAAPLWPLFRYKPWQKFLKDTWENLEKGYYDWAHIALSYWHERVSKKCKMDKSLAIAHDLEALYVEPDQKIAKRRGQKRRGEA